MAIAQSDFHSLTGTIDDGLSFKFTLSHAALPAASAASAAVRPRRPLPPRVWYGLRELVVIRLVSRGVEPRHVHVVRLGPESESSQVATPLAALSRKFVRCFPVFTVLDGRTSDRFDLNLVAFLQLNLERKEGHDNNNMTLQLPCTVITIIVSWQKGANAASYAHVVACQLFSLW